MGFDGEIQNIVGREALVQAFAATINPCKSVYHINGQHTATLNDDLTEAEGTAYCQATLVNEEDGKDVIPRIMSAIQMPTQRLMAISGVHNVNDVIFRFNGLLTLFQIKW